MSSPSSTNSSPTDALSNNFPPDQMRVVLPGGTLGVLGSGQLGRMFAIAARQMGYLVQTFSPEANSPMGQVSDKEWVAEYDDLDAIEAFAKSVDVVTFEFENVSAASTAAAAKHVPVRPGGEVLYVTQNRLREKRFLEGLGIPITPFAAIQSAADIDAAVDEVGLPGILKTAAWGYDGKGQQNVTTTAEIVRCVDEGMANVPDDADASTGLVLERRVDLAKEISIVAARSIDGTFVSYPPMENEHANHILDVTLTPARVSDELAAEAERHARAIFEALGAVGVMCVEYFVTTDGRLLVNEIAPRPHNSGHITIDAHIASQFEQQVRAVCGMPLGPPTLRQPAVMVNLLGDVWEQAAKSGGQPNWAAPLAHPDVHLHLYGKREPRRGRKMGHINVVAETLDEAQRLALAARDELTSKPPH